MPYATLCRKEFSPMLVALIVVEVRPGGPGARGKVSQAQTLPPTPLGPARWGSGTQTLPEGPKTKTRGAILHGNLGCKTPLAI